MTTALEGLDELITALSRPEAYPYSVVQVVVVKTHISVVFLAGDWVYKVKKPVDFGFLDYSTPELRRHFCEEEVRLNARYAPGVYTGVVPINPSHEVEGHGPPIAWAVKMRRLPEHCTLRALLDELQPSDLTRVGRHLAHLHDGCARGVDVSQHARLDAVTHNVEENFEQTTEHIGWSVHANVFARVHGHMRDALRQHGERIERRTGQARDTHGDLRAEHVYLINDDILIVDCVEFNARFRHADPVSDMAFLYMDLAVRGRPDLANALADAWFDAMGDADGRPLLPLYTAYRSLVRAKVRGFQGDEPRASRHWLFALGELAGPAARPRLVGVGGLPGTGKSTVALGLAAQAGFTVIRSDVVRKELAGLAPLESADPGGYGLGLYSAENKDRVYTECLNRAAEVIRTGGRAIVDASFSKERWRAQLLDKAVTLGVPGHLVWCEAPPELVHRRLDARGVDPSDADWSVYQGAVTRWEPESARTQRHLRRVDTSADPGGTIARAHTLIMTP